MRQFLFAALIVACVAPCWAADVDPYLPGDSEIIVSFNIEQMLQSPLGQRYFKGAIQEAIRSNEALAAVLKDAEFNPLNDLSRITIAMSVTEADRSFVIVRGKFRPDRIADALRKADDGKKRWKVHRDGDQTIYELPSEKDAIFAAAASDGVLLLSSQRAVLTNALRRDPTQFGKVKPALTPLITAADDRLAGWLAALPGPFQKDLPIPQDNPQQKQALNRLLGVAGALRIDTDVRLHVTLTAADAAAAQQLHATVDGVIKLLQFLAPGVVKEKPELAPLQDVVASFKAHAKDKKVHVTADVAPRVIEKMMESAKPAGR